MAQVEFGLVSFIALIAAVFPIALLGYQTLMLVDGRYGLDNLTLHYWIGESNPDIARGEPGVLHNDVILGATWNTLRLAFLASVLSSIIGLIIGYIVVRNRTNLISKILDQISFLPFLIPGIAFAAMYLGLFAVQRGPIPALYGTFALLVIISLVNRQRKFLWFVIKSLLRRGAPAARPLISNTRKEASDWGLLRSPHSILIQMRDKKITRIIRA